MSSLLQQKLIRLRPFQYGLPKTDGVILEGQALADAVRSRVAAIDTYEAIRLDPRMEELGVGISELRWDGDDALYTFMGHGWHRPKRVLYRALLDETPPVIANSVIRELRMEIEFRRNR